MDRQRARASHASLCLAPLSVSPAFQRRGVGTALVREAHRLARAAGFTSVAVIGSSAFYRRLGYRAMAEHGIVVSIEVPIEHCLIAELADGALAGVSGTVAYPAVFLAH